MSRPDVHIGRNGWLFLIGGRNSVVRQYRNGLTWWWRLRRWRTRIEARAARCERLGILFFQVVAPEKLTMMSDQCAEMLVDPTLSPATRLARLMASSQAARNYIDLIEPLREGLKDEELFLRTDTHWNYKGCFLGYKHICRALGVPPRHDLLDRPYQAFDQPMDLGIKLTPPMAETFRIHTTLQDATRRSVNELVTIFFANGGKGPVTATQAAFDNVSPRADPRRLLVFGDSYSHFDPFQLTGMFAETFREVHFVWSTSIDWRLVDEIKPDILICELAERFLTRVPNDRFDLRATVAARLSKR
jgi:alginate O-acetyltransferase complex protein AlgJ